MPKPAQSQWDFGELFPQEQARTVLSVSELTGQIKHLLEKQVGRVAVSGEVTSFRAQASGHCYFTLKDAAAQLACVLFRGGATAQRGLLRDGAKVVLRGEVSVYEARGQYQLIVRAVELQGVGALQQAFERLKAKLAAEGLFAQERKRPIPRFPQRIGLVTSPTGAAIRDVLHVIGRRQPGLEIILATCRVQGDGAGGEVAAAVRLLSEWAAGAGSQTPRLDLILVTRGGGSIEDLWAFNEEVVARAIAESAVPVVSAIGHEVDFTIADFVADLRAATPSAAAELITEGAFASREFVAGAAAELGRLARRATGDAREDLDELAHRLGLAHPRRRVHEGLQRLDDAVLALGRTARQRREQGHGAVREMNGRLTRMRPRGAVAQRRQRVAEWARRLDDLARRGLERARERQSSAEARLRLLAPGHVLARGYSITMDASTGRALRDASEVRAGQKLTTRLKTGEIRSTADGRPSAGPAT